MSNSNGWNAKSAMGGDSQSHNSTNSGGASLLKSIIRHKRQTARASRIGEQQEDTDVTRFYDERGRKEETSDRVPLNVQAAEHWRDSDSNDSLDPLLGAGKSIVSVPDDSSGVHWEQGVPNSDIEEHNGAVVVEAVTTDDFTRRLREELRSEIMEGLDVQMSNQNTNEKIVVACQDCGRTGKASNPPCWRARCTVFVAFVLLVAVIAFIAGEHFDLNTAHTEETLDPKEQQSIRPSSSMQLETNQHPPSSPAPAAPAMTVTVTPTRLPVRPGLKATFVGETENDRFGADVSLSKDGNRLAVSANNQNYVRVFENVGSAWQQIGQTIRGVGGGFGSNLDLNGDGSVMAVGAWGIDGPGNGAGQVLVFRYTGHSWKRVGQNLDGDTREDGFGWDVALSDNGKTLVVSALWGDLSNGLENEGYVRVYSLVGNSWVPKGRNIVGMESNGEFGRSVAVSSGGDRIAVGAKLAGDLDQGEVRVFDFLNGEWSQVGKALLGEEEGDYLGSSVALSSEGSTLVTAADGSDKSGENAGLARAYALVDDVWKQRGEDILGECCGGVLGAGHISTCSDGFTLAVGAQRFEGNSGKAYVYRLNNSTWEQVLAISGDKGDYFGSSVAMSGDGSLVAVGAPSDGAIGYVDIYVV